VVSPLPFLDASALFALRYNRAASESSLKLARAIADLVRSERIQITHAAETIRYEPGGQSASADRAVRAARGGALLCELGLRDEDAAKIKAIHQQREV
jgi:hypothetical protein